MLLAAAASAVLFVVVLVSMLQGRGTPTPSSVAGLPGGSATGGAVPSTSADAASPGATIVGPSGSPGPAGPFLVRASARDIGLDIHLVPGPDEGLYVSIPDRGGVAIALLGGDGLVQPGWPVRLEDEWCPGLLGADDGTVRVICDVPPPDDGLQASRSRIHAFDPAGRSLPNWPVEIESANEARMIGSDLTILVIPYRGDVPEPGVPDTIRVAIVAPDGAVRMGAEVPQLGCCTGWFAIGPDGTAYMNRTRDWDTRVRTDLLAFDADGIRPGWPISIDGNASEFAFDGQSRVHAFAMTADSERRTLILDAGGNLVGGTNEGLPYSTHPWTGAGAEAPGPLLVTADGRSFVVGGEDATMIVGLDASSAPVAGWPYESNRWMEHAGYCGGGDTGCGTTRVGPVVGADGALYVTFVAADSSAGSSIVALAPDGEVVDGWPVGLRRAGSMFWAVEPGRDGVFALAVEPEVRGYSATILSIAGDSRVRWKATIVEP
jgi:hypothetical protein